MPQRELNNALSPIPIQRLLPILLAAVVGFVTGCSDSSDGPSGPDGNTVQKSDCAGCHLDKDMLIATASPDTLPPPEDSGAG